MWHAVAASLMGFSHSVHSYRTNIFFISLTCFKENRMFRQKLNPLLVCFVSSATTRCHHPLLGNQLATNVILPSLHKYSSNLVKWKIELKHRCYRCLQTQLHTLYLKSFLERQLNTERYLGTLFSKERTVFRWYLIWGLWHQRRKLFPN